MIKDETLILGTPQLAAGVRTYLRLFAEEIRPYKHVTVISPRRDGAVTFYEYIQNWLAVVEDYDEMWVYSEGRELSFLLSQFVQDVPKDVAARCFEFLWVIATLARDGYKHDYG